jgi:hypothetical protein
MMMGLALTPFFMMGLALTPGLFMGLALIPFLVMGLALDPLCVIWFPVCTSTTTKIHHRGDLSCAFEYHDVYGVLATTLC